MEEIQQTRIRCARKDSSVYPARLKELPGMPKQLYYIILEDFRMMTNLQLQL